MVEASSAGLNVETLAEGQYVWAHAERATPVEAEYLSRRFGLHPVHLAECLGRRQRPKLVEQPDYLYLVLGTLVRGRHARSATSSEATIFLGPNFLVTIHHGDVRPVTRLFRECQGSDELRAETLGRGPAYLLYVLTDRLLNSCLQALEALNSEVQMAEESLLIEEDRAVAREAPFLRRDAAALGQLVRPQAAVLAALADLARSSPLLVADLAPYWASLAGRSEYLAESADACSSAARAVAASCDSLAARQTAEATRLIAVILATTLPLLVLTTLFGINVRDLPLADHPYAFEFALAALAAVALGTLYLFRRRRWP